MAAITERNILRETTERKHSGNKILRWKKVVKDFLQMSCKLPAKRLLNKTVEASSDGIG